MTTRRFTQQPNLQNIPYGHMPAWANVYSSSSTEKPILGARTKVGEPGGMPVMTSVCIRLGFLDALAGEDGLKKNVLPLGLGHILRDVKVIDGDIFVSPVEDETQWACVTEAYMEAEETFEELQAATIEAVLKQRANNEHRAIESELDALFAMAKPINTDKQLVRKLIDAIIRGRKNGQ